MIRVPATCCRYVDEAEAREHDTSGLIYEHAMEIKKHKLPGQWKYFYVQKFLHEKGK
jgi:hypothetical protein